MKRYIDAYKIPYHDLSDGKGLCLIAFLEDVIKVPTADVVPMDYHESCLSVEIQKRMNMVEVIRCKDCTHRKKNKFCLHNMRYEDDNGFCSYGERADA